MDFPYWGDAARYENLGRLCAEYIQSWGASGTCYEPIRPIGIALYFAFPHLFSANQVIVNSLTLLMNLICLLVIISSLVLMFLDATRSPSSSRLRRSQGVLIGAIVIGAIIVLLPFVPLRMAELPAFASLFSGMYLLGKAAEKNSSWVLFVLAGLLVGTSIIMRPVNSVQAAVGLVLLSGVYLYRLVTKTNERTQNALKPISFLVGLLVPVAFQVWWSARRTGVPWLFDQNIFVPILPPFVELRASPYGDAVVTQLTAHLSGIEYFFVKFYEGLSKLDLAVYGVDAGNPYVTFGPQKFILAVLLLAVLSAILLWPVMSTPPSLWFTSVSVWASMLYITWTYHVETRYFAPVRLMVLVVACVVADRLLRKLQSRRNANATNSDRVLQTTEPHSRDDAPFSA